MTIRETTKNGQYWTFWVRKPIIFILETRKRLTLSFCYLDDTSWWCANTFAALFSPEKKIKQLVNDDPCDLKKWSILYHFSTSWDEIWNGDKKSIKIFLCHMIYKCRSVRPRPRKTVNIEPFEHELRWSLWWRPCTISFDRPTATSRHDANIFERLFRSEGK